MSNFSFSHSVFKRLVSQGRQKVLLCGNGLNMLPDGLGLILAVKTMLYVCDKIPTRHSLVLVKPNNHIKKLISLMMKLMYFVRLEYQLWKKGFLRY